MNAYNKRKTIFALSVILTVLLCACGVLVVVLLVFSKKKNEENVYQEVQPVAEVETAAEPEQIMKQSEQPTVVEANEKAEEPAAVETAPLPSQTYEEQVIVPENERNEDYILPDSDKRYLSEDDLRGLDRNQLRLARNEIYGRHGRLFKDAAVQAYFNSKEWYNGWIAPNDFRESMLNDYEIYNAYMLLDYEKTLGYR